MGTAQPLHPSIGFVKKRQEVAGPILEVALPAYGEDHMVEPRSSS
jgi:hypothetical protein